MFVSDSSFLFFPTSLWLPPVFSSCRFSPAGMSYFFHSWCGPGSERPDRCRLSARSPQHTGKNGEFPPLWSSSFFKLFHSILMETERKCQWWWLAFKRYTKPCSLYNMGYQGIIYKQGLNAKVCGWSAIIRSTFIFQGQNGNRWREIASASWKHYKMGICDVTTVFFLCLWLL